MLSRLSLPAPAGSARCCVLVDLRSGCPEVAGVSLRSTTGVRRLPFQYFPQRVQERNSSVRTRTGVDGFAWFSKHYDLCRFLLPRLVSQVQRGCEEFQHHS